MATYFLATLLSDSDFIEALLPGGTPFARAVALAMGYFMVVAVWPILLIEWGKGQGPRH